ncbi:MAG: capsid cement protein [Syntrophobacteraceae bacterium]
MTALNADRKTSYREGIEIEYKVSANAKIYAGSLVCINASGYASPGADTANFKFVGVAMEQIDNTGGANGNITMRVRRKGVFRFAASGMAITDLGASVNVSDDQTVAKTTTNSVACGRIAEFVSATEVGIDIDMR